MQILVGYKKIRKIFRRHWREIYTPIYEDIGKGYSKPKTDKKEIKRET